MLKYVHLQFSFLGTYIIEMGVSNCIKLAYGPVYYHGYSYKKSHLGIWILKFWGKLPTVILKMFFFSSAN